MSYEQALAILEWTRTPGNHGGNPYCQDHVKAAEHVAAQTEGREIESWASRYEP